MKKCTKRGKKNAKINVLAVGGKTKSKKKKEKKKEKRNPKDVNRNVNNTSDDNVVVAVAAPLLAVVAVVADALCRVYFTPSAALHPPYASSSPSPLTVAHPTRPCFMAEPSEAKTLAIKQKSKAPAAAASADESKEQRKEQNKIKQKKQRRQKKQSKATPVECSSNITPTLCRQGSKESARERRRRREVRKEVARATATAVHIM